MVAVAANTDTGKSRPAKSDQESHHHLLVDYSTEGMAIVTVMRRQWRDDPSRRNAQRLSAAFDKLGRDDSVNLVLLTFVTLRTEH